MTKVGGAFGDSVLLLGHCVGQVILRIYFHGCDDFVEVHAFAVLSQRAKNVSVSGLDSNVFQHGQDAVVVLDFSPASGEGTDQGKTGMKKKKAKRIGNVQITGPRTAAQRSPEKMRKAQFTKPINSTPIKPGGKEDARVPSEREQNGKGNTEKTALCDGG